MSTLKATTIEPATGTNVTLGTTGDTVALPGNTLALDTWKDSGGNTLFTSNGSGVVSSVNSGLAGGGPVLIQSQTSSGSASIEFTTGIDSTYDKYMFVFLDINPSSNGQNFFFNASDDGGSTYSVSKTTTFFRAKNTESGTAPESGILVYQPASDLANSTSDQVLASGVGGAADESCAGILYLFAPSSTTYVKQFYSTLTDYQAGAIFDVGYVAGYINVTTAINALKFNFGGGTIANGTIKLYGVK